MRRRLFVTVFVISLMICVGTASALQLQTAPAKKPAPAPPAKTAPAQTPPAPTVSTSAVGSPNMKAAALAEKIIVETTSAEFGNVKIKLRLFDKNSNPWPNQVVCPGEVPYSWNDPKYNCGKTDSNGSATLDISTQVETVGLIKITPAALTNTGTTTGYVQGTVHNIVVTKAKTHLNASAVTTTRTSINNSQASDSANAYNLSPMVKICGIKLIVTSSGKPVNARDATVLLNWSPRMSSGAATPVYDLCTKGWTIPALPPPVPGQYRTWQFTAEFPGNKNFLPASKITFNISEHSFSPQSKPAGSSQPPPGGKSPEEEEREREAIKAMHQRPPTTL